MKKPAVSRNGYSGKRPTDDDRAWLWSKWQELRSEPELAKLTAPSGRTFTRGAVHRVRLEDDWDRRSVAIKLEAQARADKENAEDRSKLLGMARAITQGVLARFFDKDTGLFQIPREELKVTDFIALARFVREMQGDPNLRIAVTAENTAEQLTQLFVEALNENVTNKRERDACLATVLGGLGRIRRQPGIAGIE